VIKFLRKHWLDIFIIIFMIICTISIIFSYRHNDIIDFSKINKTFQNSLDEKLKEQNNKIETLERSNIILREEIEMLWQDATIKAEERDRKHENIENAISIDDIDNILKAGVHRKSKTGLNN